MAASSASTAASNEAYRQAITWFKTQRAEHWAQLLGDAREKRGLSRAANGQHGNFKAWVRHIERGETPCRLCTEAMEKATGALVRPPADGVPAAPVELPKVPKVPSGDVPSEVLQCEDCDYTVPADQVNRRIAMATHVRRKHGRALLDSEAKPVAREVAA